MSEQSELMPAGLSRAQFKALIEYASQAEALTAAQMLSRVKKHLTDTQLAAARSRIVNVRLATALAERFESILSDWDSIEASFQYWLGGAIMYFADSRDNDHDFTSAIGFEDDAEVLNACLKHAGRANQCIVVEDFDNA